MLPPLVSIIIPLYNAERYIAEAIESVAKQSYINWELIIVNDGSIDNSLLTAKQFQSEKIKIFDVPNAGAAAARNYGYQLSSGDYIKFFDADDLLSANMLEEQVNLAILNPDWLISSKWGRFYHDDLTTYREVPEDCWQDLDSLSWIKTSWRKGNSMTQPGMFLIPKKIVEAAGLWNTNLSLIDDFEFFARVILDSAGVKFCDKANLYYRSGMGGNALSGRKSKAAVQSAYTALELGTSYLLNKDCNEDSKLCCANTWQSFIFEFYWAAPKLAKQAEKKIVELGGGDLRPYTDGVSKILSQIIGWKATKFIKSKIRI